MKYISGSIEIHPISNNPFRYCGFEACCLCDSPGAEITAIAIAPNTEVIRICQSIGNQLFHPADDIDIINPAKFSCIGIDILNTRTERSPHIREKSDLALSSQQLPPICESIRPTALPCRCRSAMEKRHHRITKTRFIANWKYYKSMHPFTIIWIASIHITHSGKSDLFNLRV